MCVCVCIYTSVPKYGPGRFPEVTIVSFQIFQRLTKYNELLNIVRDYDSQQKIGSVDLGCTIHRLPLCRGVRHRPHNECSGYDIKRSDVEALVPLSNAVIELNCIVNEVDELSREYPKAPFSIATTP